MTTYHFSHVYAHMVLINRLVSSPALREAQARRAYVLLFLFFLFGCFVHFFCLLAVRWPGAQSV